MRDGNRWKAAWIGLAACGAGCLGSAGSALAQALPPPPHLKWTDRQHLFTGATAVDENVEMAAWTEDIAGTNEAHWVYATGWVTEMDGQTVVGTRFATYKYDAEANGTLGALSPTATAYFPPTNISLSQGDTFKAVGIVVDQFTGHVYVVGEVPNPDNNGSQDYAVIHYTEDLVRVWGDPNDWETWARYYNNDDVDGDDIPADVTIDSGGQVVVVTGTSPGDGTGLDIATVAWYTATGNLVTDLWPVVNGKQPVAGVRRYDNLAYHGDDTAAELGPLVVVELQGAIIDVNVIVLGTTYNGAAALKDFTTHDWDTYDTSESNGAAWDQKFNLGGDDIATGIAGPPNGSVWCVGYSEIPADDFLDVPQPNIDYSIVSYLANGTFRWSDNWDYYQGGQDFCYDVDAAAFGDGTHIWLTGEAHQGARADVGTVHYLESGGGHTRDFTAGFNVGGSTTFNYGLGIHISREVPQGSNHGLPYITGSTGGSTWQYMLILKYKDSGGSYALDWNRTTTGGTGFNEGRDIVAGQVEQPTSGNVSVYPTGVLSTSTNGREGSTARYRE